MKLGKILLRILLVILTFVLITVGGALYTLDCICHGPSETARDLFVSTILETGALQFLESWYFSEEEILAIKDDEERVKAIAQHLNMFT